MNTLRIFAKGIELIPTSASWYLTDLGEALGKQKLFTRQLPQKLKTLREHAIIESAVSSNRIEGVEINQARVGTVIFGKSLLQDRNEEEIRGYRQALELVHKHGSDLSVSEKTILDLHKYARGDIWDAGKYKEKQGDIIEKYADGTERIRFKTVEPGLTPEYISHLTELWGDCLKERWVPPLIALAAFNLDFLCIHPFRDGNGRVSRLLMLLQSYHIGYEVGRYISLEKLIEQNKDRYYETLEQSSAGWHESRHDPWPYINYVLSIFNLACKEFEKSVGHTVSEKGAKTSIIKSSIEHKIGPFSVSELQLDCPDVSIDMIRKVLKRFKVNGLVECLGRGQQARWQKTDKWQLGNDYIN
ncbi:Fic/DOC family protein [Limihaloglobus sulfuriphilus]|uniref:Fic/DOC family protein n=1 Tax=Limihaloglobus sulfuriphilus TaxID=1851148 RepID=A0A1Q2ME38_9BACT|nr:Fic family protein [Limihaloglobus sulfuriphilus]AQQ70966.1 Fic/DOC family protein [Limihaloglobus sulfuriphilus]